MIDVPALAGAEIVENDDLIRPRRERVGKAGAYKASSPCDQILQTLPTEKMPTVN